MSERLQRALSEFAKLNSQTCPCKRDVILVEALHGYAEALGYRLGPVFPLPDGDLELNPCAASGDSAALSRAPDPELKPLVELLGHPGGQFARKISPQDLSLALEMMQSN